MVVRKKPAFTPEVLLSAPRRGTGIPSPDGSLIVYSESAYSFKTQTQSSEIRVINTDTSHSVLVTSDSKCSNPTWLTQQVIALLRSSDDGSTELVLGNVLKFAETCYTAGHIDGPADNLKVAEIGKDFWGVAVTANASPDGSIFNPKKASGPRSSGRLYNSLFVRHWDQYVTPQRSSIFYGALLTGKASELKKSKKTYTLSTITNALKGTSLESPIPTFGGSDHFDISKSGIVFVAKDPALDPALNTKCNVYYVQLTNFLETTPTVDTVKLPGFEGALTSPVFSPDGSKIAFLAMKQNGYEADQNRILVMPDVTRLSWIHEVPDYPLLSPQSLVWSEDGDNLYFTAESSGITALFGHPVSATLNRTVPQRHMYALYNEASIDNITIISRSSHAARGTDRLFVSSSSFVASRIYGIMDIRMDAATTQTVKTISGPSEFGLSSSQISRLHSPPADPQLIDAIESWVINPPKFDNSKKYPLALFVHGGPQASWLSAWSTRWNPAVFASQGYVVVAPNITGSTGYGQAFVNAIREDWGGRPYQDLCKLFEHIEKKVPYVDTSRAVALGASYGGYMMNWIQGHDLGRKFKAIVTHDGVFSNTFEMASDELYFLNHDIGGYYCDGPEARKRYERWDPSRFTEHWSTPNLIIHSEKDYRLTMADGLAAFNTLQIRGIESQFLTFPDENHWVLKPENSLLWHTTVFNFINEHVGLPAYEHKYMDRCDTAQVGAQSGEEKRPAHTAPHVQAEHASASKDRTVDPPFGCTTAQHGLPCSDRCPLSRTITQDLSARLDEIRREFASIGWNAMIDDSGPPLTMRPRGVGVGENYGGGVLDSIIGATRGDGRGVTDDGRDWKAFDRNIERDIGRMREDARKMMEEEKSQSRPPSYIS